MPMPRSIVPALVAPVLLPVMLMAQAPASEPPPRPFLRKAIQLTDAQLSAVEKGEVVTKLLPSPEKAEIAAFGIVKVRGSRETLAQKVRDIQSFRKIPQIPEIGRFSNPPRVEDLQGLHWDDGDIDALKKCKAGECNVKIGTAALDRLKTIDWSAPDAKARFEALAREQMVDYMKAYQAGGTDAMGVIVDKKQPRQLSNDFRTLLKNSPYLPEYVPAFNQYLASYPKGSLENAEDLLYWTKDTFGLKPVVSMYHLTIHNADAGLLVAMKTLYASHYFNGALELMAAVNTPDAATSPGFYLMDLYRARIDPPTGMLSGMLMGKVKSGIEQGVGENLKAAKARVEGGK